MLTGGQLSRNHRQKNEEKSWKTETDLLTRQGPGNNPWMQSWDGEKMVYRILSTDTWQLQRIPPVLYYLAALLFDTMGYLLFTPAVDLAGGLAGRLFCRRIDAVSRHSSEGHVKRMLPPW